MELLEDLKLRESLTKRPPEDMRQLMRRIEEYKRLEDDQLQSKGKAPLLNRSRRFSLKATKRLKNTRFESTNGGSECGIQGASTQDRGSNQERAILQMTE